MHPRTGDCVIGNLEYGELFERDRGLEGSRGKCSLLLLLLSLLLFLLFRSSKGEIGIDGKSEGDLKEGEDQRAFCCGCRKVDTQIARDKRAHNFHIFESIQLIKPLIVIIETFVLMFSASEKER